MTSPSLATRHRPVATQIVADDYSRGFQALRARLRNDQGEAYSDFVRRLSPDYRSIYFDVARGYLFLIASAAASLILPAAGLSPWISTPVAAILIGYWIAYLQLFIHEGAHYNLAPQRENSDRLCDLFVGWMIGTRVADYRKVHFQHHRALGTTDDSEFSYFFPVNLLGLAKSALGVRALKVMLARRKFLEDSKSRKATRADAVIGTTAESPGNVKSDKDATGSNGSLYPLIGLSIHGLIIVGSYVAGAMPLAIAWAIGTFMFFPLFGALRQALEHRREDADPGTDYRQTDHGHFTRIFGDDVFSATFGGAGFNRHLLHHWEPQVSYTNLPQLETFLMKTDMGKIIDSRRSSYGDVFLNLLSLR